MLKKSKKVKFLEGIQSFLKKNILQTEKWPQKIYQVWIFFQNILIRYTKIFFWTILFFFRALWIVCCQRATPPIYNRRQTVLAPADKTLQYIYHTIIDYRSRRAQIKGSLFGGKNSSNRSICPYIFRVWKDLVKSNEKKV